MNRVLLVIGGLLVGLLAILFAVPAMVDWNRYRGVFEEEASRLLGREVRVAGNVNLRLLPVPYVQFEKVRIADTTANVGRPLFYADDFTVWLSVGGLLTGAFEAKDIQLAKPVVTLVLDGRGGGSWSSLLPKRGQSLLVPSRVAFASVHIHSGKLEILGPDGSSKAMFDQIDGELSGQDIDGPYKVAANLSISGAPREVRLSTAKAADDGSVRFKGSVRDPQSGASYSLDGIAHDILKTVAIEGEVTARLPLPAALASADGKAAVLSRTKAESEFDVRAKLKGNTTGFTLDDLALSFEQAGRPQLATGSAKVNWSDKTQVDVALSSQWLDLDRIAGSESGASATSLMQGVASSLSRILATDGRTQAVLRIEQATLGGDIVSQLNATLEQAQGRLGIKALSAQMPGGTRLSASGVFEGALPDYRYSGQINLRGASLSRFAAWSGRGANLPLPERDGPYSLRGEIAIGARELTGKNLTIELARNLLTGDASWKAGEPQRIEARLEGTEIDVSPLVEPAGDAAAQLRDLVAALAGAAPSPSSKRAKSGIGAADADIKLRLDRLVVGSGAYRDVSAELKIAGGNLSMPLLKLNSPDGFSVELRGDLTDFARSAVKGALTGLAEADTPAGVIALIKASGLPPTMVTEQSAQLIAPLRLAGRLAVGQRGAETHELSVDGMLAKSRVAGTVRLGSPTTNWRERSVDAAVTVEGSDAPKLAALAMGQGAAAEGLPSAPGARVDVRAIGNAATGLTSLATLNSAGGRSQWQGRVSIDETGVTAFGGQLELAVSDLGRELSLIGLKSRPGLTGPATGVVRLEKSGAPLKLAATDLQIGSSKLGGQIAIEKSGEGWRLSGQLHTDKASIPSLLAALSAPSTAGRGSSGGGGSPWSETPFDLSVLDAVADGQIQVEVRRLALAPNVEIEAAALSIAAKPGGLEIRLKDGKALGGAATGVLGLDKAPAGARLSVQLALNGGRLEKLAERTGGGQAAATGLVGATFAAQSTALSPRGAIAALTGNGNLRFGLARVNRWSPAAVAAEVTAIVETKGDVAPEAMRARLEASTHGSGVTLDRQSVAVIVGDGGLRIAPLTVGGPAGRFTGRLGLDLDQLTLSGDVRIEASARQLTRDPAAKAELPAVTITYAGPLVLLDKLEPRYDTETLQREVVVRKVERDVQELERLRQEDQDRVRVERERLESERQEAERRLAERLKLEALQRLTPPIPASAPPGPASAQPPSGNAPAPAASEPGAGQGAASAVQVPTGAASSGTAVTAPGDASGSTSPALVAPPQPATRAPGASPPPAANRQRRDPFRSLIESSP